MKKKILLVVAILVGLIISCRKQDLDQFNPNQLTPESYFKNSAELISGVNSIYAILQSNALIGREWFFLNHLRGDDFASGGGQLETPRNQLLNGVHDPSNFVLTEVWNGNYRAIHRANTVIERASDAIDKDSDLSKRAIAEARFLRAWAYSELVLFWGGVPLYTSVATKTGDSKPRSSEDEVINFVLSELDAIETLLPDRYTGVDLGRVTRGASLALKARTKMWKGDYAGARADLLKIVASGTYSLVEKYTDNFEEENEWNSESVFEMGYSIIGDINWVADGNDPDWGNQERMVRTQEYSPTGWRNLIPAQTVIDEYESTFRGDAVTDPRRAFSLWVIGDKFNNGQTLLTDSQVQGNTSSFEGNTTKVSWRKYTAHYKSDPGGYNNLGINYRIIRYAEVLLMLAECELEVGSQSEAIRLMNVVRSRASVQMPPYPTSRFPCSNKAETFQALVHEKRVEFAGEEVRNRDILRWRRQNKLTPEITPVFNYNFEQKHLLLPIPQTEIDNNDKIDQQDQNPGY